MYQCLKIKKVSVPYEITLLSNRNYNIRIIDKVSVPYEITLLSNGVKYNYFVPLVSVPYEITLLSNLLSKIQDVTVFQYLMKLHYSQTPVLLS